MQVYVFLGELRYWHSSQNNGRVLERPLLVRNRDDFHNFLRELEHADILEWARQQRPNTKWIVDIVTNATVFLNKIIDHPIGSPVVLPEYITKNKHVVGLVKDENTSTPYDDNLCLFRCIALHKGYNYHNINNPAKALLQTYQPGIHPKAFLGVKMNELSKVEKVFRVNIEV